MWNRLDPGDAVAVVAPAGPPPPERYRLGLEVLERRYRVVRRHQPTEGAPFPYLADDDLARAKALNAALADEAVRALFCARGGYGCSRILAHLDARLFAERRLPLVGFSDVTALHAWAATLGVPTIHGPVVTQFCDIPASDVAAVFALLEGRSLPQLEGLETIVAGPAVEGPLLGGNLALLAHLCGTPHLPEMAGAILLLEDVDEAPYRLDRQLTQLQLSGVLDGVAGILLGDFVDCDGEQGDPPQMVAARSVLARRLSQLGVPLVAGAPVGHGRRNLPLPLGLPARLDPPRGTLTFAPLERGGLPGR